MFSNPVLNKELRCAFRHGRPFWVMAGYVAALVAALAYLYPDLIEFIEGQSPSVGRQLFRDFSFVQAVLVLLVTPALAAPAIAGERERRTLELLLIAPLAARDLLKGKIASVMCHLSLLVFASLPLTSVCFMLGGVSPTELLMAYAALIFAALVATGVSVTASVYFARTYSATAVAYWATFVLAPVGAILAYVWPVGILALLAYPLFVFQPTTPLRAALHIAYSIAAFLAFIWIGLHQFWGVPSLLYGTLNFFCVLVFGLRFLPNLVETQVGKLGGGLLPGEGSQGEGEGAAEAQPRYPGRRIKKRARLPYAEQHLLPERWNPILVRDLRRVWGGRWGEALAVAGGVGIALVILYPHPDIFTVGVLLMTALMMGVAAFLGALTLSRERDQGTLDSLRLTGLKPHQILAGKLGAALAGASYLLLPSMSVLFLAGGHRGGWSGGLAVTLMQTTLILFATGWGLFCSVVCGSVRRAVAMAGSGIFALVAASVLMGRGQGVAEIPAFLGLGGLADVLDWVWFTDSGTASAAWRACLFTLGTDGVLTLGLLAAACWLFARRR